MNIEIMCCIFLFTALLCLAGIAYVICVLASNAEDIEDEWEYGKENRNDEK